MTDLTPLRALIEKWRAKGITARREGAATTEHAAISSRWKGQQVGYETCADDLEAVLAAVAPAPDARFRDYVQHKLNCDVAKGLVRLNGECRCNCGLAALLAPGEKSCS